MPTIRKDNKNERTVVISLTLTDILKVPKDDDKAEKQQESEIARIIRGLKKLGIDDVELGKVKTFIRES